MTIEAKPGWVKLAEDDSGWYCEGDCGNETEPTATWGFKPYEATPAGSPAYLCDTCYKALNQKGTD